MAAFMDATVLNPPAPLETVLKQIIGTLVERVHPRRLILFGSRARGDARPDSDYDLVVEMDSAIASSWDFAREIERLFPRGKGWSLNVFPRGLGEIERAADDPGTVDWDIVREGKVLFAAEGVSSVLAAPPPRVGEGPRDASSSVRTWAARGASDLDHAHRSAGMGGSWEYVCFHAQQSAEKFLKALLVRRFKRPKRTHELDELLDDAIAAGAPVRELHDDCVFLTPFAITTRYGPLGEFDEATGRAALAAADRIAAVVTPLLG